MGCFSFLCKECGNQIVSDNKNRDDVILYLLKNGKVIETIEGKYDSYGGVYSYYGVRKSFKTDWDEVCDLMEGGCESGIAAIHKECFTGVIPKCESDFDPDQGQQC